MLKNFWIFLQKLFWNIFYIFLFILLAILTNLKAVIILLDEKIIVIISSTPVCRNNYLVGVTTRTTMMVMILLLLWVCLHLQMTNHTLPQVNSRPHQPGHHHDSSWWYTKGFWFLGGDHPKLHPILCTLWLAKKADQRPTISICHIINNIINNNTTQFASSHSVLVVPW